MGRKPGSKNKPKPAPTADGSPATTKHNQAVAKGDLTEDQQRVLLASAVRDYERDLHAKNDASAAFIKTCKRIKGDGVSLDNVKTAIKLQTPEGEAALKAKIEAEVRVARWYNAAAFGTQFGLFGGNGHDHDATASYQAGKLAGLQGETAKAPERYDVNEWLRGWQEGQHANASKIKQQKQRDADEFDAAPATVN